MSLLLSANFCSPQLQKQSSSCCSRINNLPLGTCERTLPPRSVHLADALIGLLQTFNRLSFQTSPEKIKPTRPMGLDPVAALIHKYGCRWVQMCPSAANGRPRQLGLIWQNPRLPWPPVSAGVRLPSSQAWPTSCLPQWETQDFHMTGCPTEFRILASRGWLTQKYYS